MKNYCYCSCSKHKELFSYRYYKIVQCSSCNQVRTITPVGIPRVQEYTKDYVAIYIRKEKIFRQIFQRIILFIQKVKKSGTLLDIGAGVGLLVDEAKVAGFDAYGFEPSKYAVIAAKKYFGISLFPNKFNSIIWNTKSDVIVLNHVLEHLPNPKIMIRDVYVCLNQKGILVIGVPNFGNIISKLKKSRWQSLIPDQHRWHFTIDTLDNLVLPFGFTRIVRTSDNHDRGIHPWWKRPIYFVIDIISTVTGNGEAILVIYKKND